MLRISPLGESSVSIVFASATRQVVIHFNLMQGAIQHFMFPESSETLFRHAPIFIGSYSHYIPSA
jgi:hypothetical protein